MCAELIRQESLPPECTVTTAAHVINMFMLMCFWNDFKVDVIMPLSLFSYPVVILKGEMSCHKEGETAKIMWIAVSWQLGGLTFSSCAVASYSFVKVTYEVPFYFSWFVRWNCWAGCFWGPFKLWDSMSWYYRRLGKGFWTEGPLGTF